MSVVQSFGRSTRVTVVPCIRLFFVAAMLSLRVFVCPSIGWSVGMLIMIESKSGKPSVLDIFVYVSVWGMGFEMWMGVGCLCPPVRNDIVTPRHLFPFTTPFRIRLLQFAAKDKTRSNNFYRRTITNPPSKLPNRLQSRWTGQFIVSVFLNFIFYGFIVVYFHSSYCTSLIMPIYSALVRIWSEYLRLPD